MLRFDRFIRPSMCVRDVKQRYPQTNAIFDKFEFRPICDDCSIEVVARRQGLASFELIDALNWAIQSDAGIQE